MVCGSFSVLISVWERDESLFLTQALSSILDQTLKPAELVLVIDGYIPDKLRSVISWLEGEVIEYGIELVLVENERNLGLGLALRKGAMASSRPYLIRMDSDDISRPNRIAELASLVEHNPDVGVFGAYIEEFNENPGDLMRIRQVPEGTEEIYVAMDRMNPVNHVTACIKREVLLKTGNYEHCLSHEDYFLWLKFRDCGVEFKNAPQVHVDVRTTGLGLRRSGLGFIKREFSFVLAAYTKNYFTCLTAIRYFLPRLIFRLLPLQFVELIYSRQRSSI